MSETGEGVSAPLGPENRKGLKRRRCPHLPPVQPGTSGRCLRGWGTAKHATPVACEYLQDLRSPPHGTKPV